MTLPGPEHVWLGYDVMLAEASTELGGRVTRECKLPVPTVDKIGDCDAPAIIAAAVYAGHRYARELGADGVRSDMGRQDKVFIPD